MADLVSKGSKKNKHLTMEERMEIQECLDRGVSYKAIGKRIGKDQTTISKEVKRHLVVRESGTKRLKEDGMRIEADICPSLIKAPFVCNPCQRRRNCPQTKHFYNAKHAQVEYERLRTESREGIPLQKEAFYEIDRIVTEKVKDGQHVYHILQTQNLGISKSTLYRHINQGYLSVSRIDLPRAVKFKPRKAQYMEYIPKSLKIGRTFEDFTLFREENGVVSWVEMDTVIGRTGGKVILTVDFTFCNFMAGLLLDNKTSAEAANKVIALKETLKKCGLSFGDIFSVLLTDNGGEFSDVYAFEKDLNGNRETHLFFCDPNRAYQKPRVEKNHTLFRVIVPKGSSYDDFCKDTVNLVFSHVNSVKRKALNGKSPYEIFTYTYGGIVAETLGIKMIPVNKVVQSPKLLAKASLPLGSGRE
jgi:IS30 family transposase